MVTPPAVAIASYRTVTLLAMLAWIRCGDGLPSQEVIAEGASTIHSNSPSGKPQAGPVIKDPAHEVPGFKTHALGLLQISKASNTQPQKSPRLYRPFRGRYEHWRSTLRKLLQIFHWPTDSKKYA
ncbi:hypothetical protein PAXRUDRAFT_15756 [Paxillus rubicundulus Ve08.2h10]|uniref:Unplaced genomic scaffold scaffold_1181, whole genome shotgun sequence n=1 Tax=Paxillus rubicundulus Ve08.2h10 TaxID=930991 RepID=A0A0D0CY47_9AGAM|nr:hypothetical protein PAXRUDRAFT_15756 [Paxillus rubicundulus Ve08.2h10]